MLVGCLRNAAACAGEAFETAVARGNPIGIVCSGFAGSFAIDDAYCAGYLGAAICRSAQSVCQTIVPTESAAAAMALTRGFPTSEEALRLSESGKLVERQGAADELVYCASPDVSRNVPHLIWGIGEGGTVHKEIVIREDTVRSKERTLRQRSAS